MTDPNHILRAPNLRRKLVETFDPAAGHDHDGVNSKAVSAGTPAAGSLAKTVGGRAIMAADYFDAATVADKFDANCISAANLLLMVEDGAFAADAATRALFAAGIFQLSHLATTAKTHVLSYQVETLAAGVDITARTIFEGPTGLVATGLKATLISQGTAVGIDDSNKCTVTLLNGTNAIVSYEMDSNPAFPAAGVSVDLGALSAQYKVIAAGEKLKLSVTNGTTANPPAFMLQLTYSLADA